VGQLWEKTSRIYVVELYQSSWSQEYEAQMCKVCNKRSRPTCLDIRGSATKEQEDRISITSSPSRNASTPEHLKRRRERKMGKEGAIRERVWGAIKVWGFVLVASAPLSLDTMYRRSASEPDPLPGSSRVTFRSVRVAKQQATFPARPGHIHVETLLTIWGKHSFCGLGR